MDLLITKLIVTPSLMWFVSYVSKRWGSIIGGLLSGMPLTSAPISIYLAAEQGTSFARAAAISSISGLTAVTFFYLIYAIASRFVTLLGTAAMAFIGFALSIFELKNISNQHILLAITNLILVTFVLILCRRRQAGESFYKTPWWDVPARMVSATILVLAVTITAPIAGPVISGILAPMPVIAWPLVLFIHSRQGRTQAIDVVRGTVQGSLGVLVFYLLVGALLGAVHPTLAYFIAVCGAVGVTAPCLWWNITSRRETNGGHP